MTPLERVIAHHGVDATVAGVATRIHISDDVEDRQRGAGHPVSAVRHATATLLPGIAVPDTGDVIAVATGPHAAQWSVVRIVARDAACTVVALSTGRPQAFSARRVEVTA